MIFHPVSNIKDKDEFIELINIYCRLVEVMAERNRMPVTNIKTISDSIVNELSDMGIITRVEDLSLLKKMLDKTYDRLTTQLFSALSLTSLAIRKGHLFNPESKIQISPLLWISSLEQEASV